MGLFSGDDLITPVYVPPTRSPVTTVKNSSKTQQVGKPCDDEDCFTGSGSGEVTTPEETSTTTKGMTYYHFT
jgi:leucine-rich repeat transmembrane neuronal protein 1/2